MARAEKQQWAYPARRPSGIPAEDGESPLRVAQACPPYLSVWSATTRATASNARRKASRSTEPSASRIACGTCETAKG